MKITNLTFTLSSTISNPHVQFENRKPEFSITAELVEGESIRKVAHQLRDALTGYVRECEDMTRKEWDELADLERLAKAANIVAKGDAGNDPGPDF